MRMAARARLTLLVGLLVAIAGVLAAVSRGTDSASLAPALPAGVSPGITEDDLPSGFSKAPSVTVGGKRYRFDSIPGHYWKLLDKRGFAIGLHFQTDDPFPWARDVPKGELLYFIYAIPGTCGDGNYAKAVKSPNATVYGRVPPGFDHWHGFVGGGSKVGTWYTHIPVRDFTLAGPPGNPSEGAQVTAGTPKFIPVCDVL